MDRGATEGMRGNNWPEGLGRDFIMIGSESWASGSQTSKHHLIKQFLALGARVLYVENISMRRIGSGGSKDLGKAFRALGRFVAGLSYPQENLAVWTPVYLPFPKSKLATRLNKRLLPAMIRFYARRAGLRNPTYIFFMPTGAPLVGCLGESLSVYYITDNYASFTDVEREAVLNLERQAIAQADVVFATASSLVAAKQDQRKDIHYSPHGVDFDHFAKALASEMPVPEDLAAIQEPRLGFMGALSTDWVDYKLIIELARRHRNWQFVLFGRVMSDLSEVLKEPNVHYLGVKSYEELPGYLKGLNISLIPFLVNDLSKDINPIKLREYLAAGLPVVATDLPPLRQYGSVMRLVQGVDEYETAIKEVLANPGSPAEQQASVRSETWAARASTVLQTLAEASRKKQRT